MRADRLFVHFAYFAGRGIRLSQPLLFMITRGRYERQLSGVRTPLHVGPLAAPADDVIAERGTVLIGLDLEASDFFRIDVDHDALDRRYDIVAG